MFVPGGWKQPTTLLQAVSFRISVYMLEVTSYMDACYYLQTTWLYSCKLYPWPSTAVVP